jgi:hypothetical protein
MYFFQELLLLVLSGVKFPLLTTFSSIMFQCTTSSERYLRSNLNCVFQFGYYGITVFLSIDKKFTMESVYEINFGSWNYCNLFVSKVCSVFLVNDAYFQQTYGPDFVNALKQDM